MLIKNINKVLIFVTISLFISCTSSNKVKKIYWDGSLVKTSTQINYLFWNDGNQFLTQEKDSLKVSITGFDFDNTLYILISLTNNKRTPVTFFTKECKIQYDFNTEKINLNPIKSKNLDKDHFSVFNAVLEGAGSLSRLFLNIPVDMLFRAGKNDSDTPNKITAEYHDENSNMSKKIFMNNHTLFPGTNYGGFLVYEYDKEKSMVEKSFDFVLDKGSGFVAQGHFIE